MLILRFNRSKGVKQKKPQYIQVIQNEDGTLTILHRDGSAYSNPGAVINNHGGILGMLVRCLEIEGTIDEYVANTPRNEIRKQWDMINARWKEFKEYQKSLQDSVATEEISS